MAPMCCGSTGEDPRDGQLGCHVHVMVGETVVSSEPLVNLEIGAQFLMA